jgi:hypothetical protein
VVAQERHARVAAGEPGTQRRRLYDGVLCQEPLQRGCVGILKRRDVLVEERTGPRRGRLADRYWACRRRTSSLAGRLGVVQGRGFARSTAADEGSGAIPFRRRQVRMVEGGSRGRGSQLMKCSLGQALQGTLAILAKVRPADLNPGLAAGLLSQARLAVAGACRGPDGQALFGPVQRGSGRAGTGRPSRHLPRPRGVSRAR